MRLWTVVCITESDYDNTTRRWQQQQRKQRECRRNDVSIGRRMRELRGQIGRHNSWDEECQPDEAEAVEDEQRLQRFGPLPNAEFRPNVSGGC